MKKKKHPPRKHAPHAPAFMATSTERYHTEASEKGEFPSWLQWGLRDMLVEGDFKQFMFLQGEIILAFKLRSEMQGNSKSRVVTPSPGKRWD